MMKKRRFPKPSLFMHMGTRRKRNALKVSDNRFQI